MAKIKTFELRKKSRAELEQQLKELRNELAQLRVAKVTGAAASKLIKIKTVRKNIAQVLTVINQTKRDMLRKHFAGEKYKPLDLRYKKTRAIRRAMTPSQRNAKTSAELRIARHFPPNRKFALKE